MELPLLDIMYKWNHTVCSLLCLSPLSITFSVFLHVVVHISTASNFLALVWISTVFSLPLLGSPTACSPRKPGWCSSNVNQITSLLYLESSKGFLFYLENNFFFLLYNIVLVLPYINMNPPCLYTCSQSWTPLPPPSSYHPSGSSQCTSPKLPVPCIEPGLVIHFLYDIIHLSMPFSQIIPCPLAHRVQKTVLYICVSFAVSLLMVSKTFHWSGPYLAYFKYQPHILHLL